MKWPSFQILISPVNLKLSEFLRHFHYINWLGARLSCALNSPWRSRCMVTASVMPSFTQPVAETCDTDLQGEWFLASEETMNSLANRLMTQKLLASSSQGVGPLEELELHQEQLMLMMYWVSTVCTWPGRLLSGVYLVGPQEVSKASFPCLANKN